MPVNTPSLGPDTSGIHAEGQRTNFDALSVATDGQSVSPPWAFASDVSLGFWRSAASHVALSYGTFQSQISSSGISVGNLRAITTNFVSGISVGSSSNTGSLIPAISSMSSLVGAFVVNGSSSSFTGIAWPAAQIGDIIITGVIKSGAASSISSGLVPHSHVTVAGQIEFRLSNVSTLVQNQSAQSWVFVRITPF